MIKLIPEITIRPVLLHFCFVTSLLPVHFWKIKKTWVGWSLRKQSPLQEKEEHATIMERTIYKFKLLDLNSWNFVSVDFGWCVGNWKVFVFARLCGSYVQIISLSDTFFKNQYSWEKYWGPTQEGPIVAIWANSTSLINFMSCSSYCSI